MREQYSPYLSIATRYTVYIISVLQTVRMAAILPAGYWPLPDGSLYGLTRMGGANDEGAFFRLTSPDGTPETLFSFSINEGNLPAGSLVETPDGDLNGTSTTGALNGAGEPFKINKDGTNLQVAVSLL